MQKTRRRLIIDGMMLSLLIFLIVTALQYGLFSSRSHFIVMGDDYRTEIRYGLGSPVSAITENGTARTEIHYFIFIINTISCVGFAIYASWLLQKHVQARCMIRAYVLSIIATLIIAFALAMSVTKATWGYYFERPDLLPVLNDIVNVISLVPVTTQTGETGKRDFIVNDKYPIDKVMQQALGNTYYCLDERILFWLQETSKLPEAFDTDLSGFVGLYDLVTQTELIDSPNPGHDHSLDLTGTILDATELDGGRIVYVAVSGGEVSNDLHPYYELIFRPSGIDGSLVYYTGQRFYFDVAGMEGVEWEIIFALFSLVGLFLVLPVVTICLILKYRRESKLAMVMATVSP